MSSGEDRAPGQGRWEPGGRGEMPVPDFAKVFDEAPAPFLLLTPDLVIVHANRARLEATATTLEEQVGRHLFEVFPMNPDDPAADGLRNLRASLELTRQTRRPQTMALQKYDIPVPGGGSCCCSTGRRTSPSTCATATRPGWRRRGAPAGGSG